MNHKPYYSKTDKYLRKYGLVSKHEPMEYEIEDVFDRINLRNNRFTYGPIIKGSSQRKIKKNLQ